MMSDQEARKTALDVQQSFIIQAPAGSGKTELLTQRYLALLAQACESPEEIIALTFTRKAAAEMRERILCALEQAKNSPAPESPHRLNTWQLAQQVLNKDQLFQWQILLNPQRIKIMTLDSLAAQLTARLPILSGFGASSRIVEDAFPYYQQTITYVLSHLSDQEPWTTSISTLLLHCDNQIPQVEKLLTDMLARRDQWLPYIAPYNAQSSTLRQHLQQALQGMVTETLEATQTHVSTALAQRLVAIGQAAGQYLMDHQIDHPITACAHLDEWPAAKPEYLSAWLGLTQLLLTKEGQWRNQVDKRIGLPPDSPEKKSLLQLLAGLKENQTLLIHLQEILLCPPVQYSESQWPIITALIHLLPILVAQLQVIFQQQGVIDFVELGLAASRALGEDDQPTDLTLSLDYRISHILVDEFQDTSVVQFRLLEKLISGWEKNDGRSIFLVGDPMQSIYRFRNAEVGLFLSAKKHGIGQIPLTYLSLHMNFRSQSHLVDWFNRVFPQILAPEDDLMMGAISYSPAVAALDPASATSPAIQYHVVNDADDQASMVVNMIKQIHAQNSAATIAILVRARSHLLSIAPALHAAKISFQATAIEPLSERSEILDLFALTRALWHRGDRIAWLSILRAPYCGLKLADLHIIATAASQKTLYQTLIDYPNLALSDDAQQRLQRIVPVLIHAMDHRGRVTISTWIENIWLLLAGPAGLDHSEQLANTQLYFQLLSELEQEYGTLNLTILEKKLQKLYAAPNPHGDQRLQIMTIHKAKGLEFDHVILPDLNRKIPPDPSRLLLWLEKPTAEGGSDLILAPIKAFSAEDDLIYRYLRQIEQKKLTHESNRLLYVAATRAKHCLHLIAALSDDQPKPNSFLAMLWPFYTKESVDEPILNDPPPAVVSTPSFKRVVENEQLPRIAETSFPSSRQQVASIKPIPLTLLSSQPQIIGTVIHELLAHTAENFNHFNFNSLYWQRRLLQLGLPKSSVPEAITSVKQALDHTLQDPRGLWILSPEHQDCHNEYALSTVVNNQIIHVIIDRTFVDANGIRWIVDYKTSNPETLTEMTDYREQLTRYAFAMSLLDSRPIRLGLYFPLNKHWEEWSYL